MPLWDGGAVPEGRAGEREALFAYDFYAKMNELFTTLTRRWVSAGMLPKGTDPDALAGLLVTLMPGMLVMSHLYELPASKTLVTGIADFAKAAGKR